MIIIVFGSNLAQYIYISILVLNTQRYNIDMNKYASLNSYTTLQNRKEKKQRKSVVISSIIILAHHAHREFQDEDIINI